MGMTEGAEELLGRVVEKMLQEAEEKADKAYRAADVEALVYWKLRMTTHQELLEKIKTRERSVEPA